MNGLEKKYNFVDIYIFGKTNKGYISLSDWRMCEEQSSLMQFDSDSQYLIGFNNFHEREYYIAEISLEELLALAGITATTNFIKQFRSGVDNENADNLMAIMCSQKILNYRFGKCVNTEEGMEFKRRQLENGKRVYNVVLKKELRKEKA